MDYTQRHQAAMDAIRKDFDENEDEVLKVPNYSLMERFFVYGGKDPWLFFNNMWKIIYPANKKKSRNAIDDLRNELDLHRQNREFEEEMIGLFGLMKHNNTEDLNINGNWFHRTEFNCGALQLPSSTEELFAITKNRQFWFFKSIIQANVRKEAEDIPLAAFEFWTDKKVNILFEEEINKFLWSDVSSEIDGYEFGFLSLMIALIKTKKHIDLLPQHIKKEELRDTRLSKFVKLPIEIQRKELISEQEKILDFLELKTSFIMNLIKKELEKDDFIVEPYAYRNRKNLMRTYKGFQILIERKFEIFMNLILFRNIISKFWTEDFSQEVLICLVRAGMVIVNIRIWRDFLIVRDSEFETIKGSNITSRPKLQTSSTNKGSKGKRKNKTGNLDSIKDVLHAEAESKKEETKYDSDETVSAEDLDLNVSNSLNQTDPSKRSSEPILKISGYSKAQEVISISSDSEQENAEQKIAKALLWKSRPPKKCNKYIPEEVLGEKEIGWLSRRQAPSKSFPANVLESLVENMSSTEPCYSQGGNEQMPVALSSDMNYIAKHSSNTYNPSKTISSSYYGPTSLAKEVPNEGMSLRPRMVQDTLSKL